MAETCLDCLHCVKCDKYNDTGWCVKWEEFVYSDETIDELGLECFIPRIGGANEDYVR